MTNKRMTRPPTHPGAILKYDYLEPLNLTIAKLADYLGVSRITVSKIVNERAPVSPDMAVRLSVVFHTTPGLWLNLQKTYDIWHSERNAEHWAKQPRPFSMPENKAVHSEATSS